MRAENSKERICKQRVTQSAEYNRGLLLLLCFGGHCQPQLGTGYLWADGAAQPTMMYESFSCQDPAVHSLVTCQSIHPLPHTANAMLACLAN